MAITIKAAAGVANWQNSTARSITISYVSGDVVVVTAGGENATEAPVSAPTATNITFSSLGVDNTGGFNECSGGFWIGTATGSGSSISISDFGIGNFGAYAWVLGGATQTGAALTGWDTDESGISITTSAGDFVAYAAFDWNASTGDLGNPSTGSGSSTERVSDVGNSSNYAVFIADWLGASAGTFGFNISSYTGYKMKDAGVRVPASATGTEAPAGHASSTGTSYNASVNVDPAAEQASSTGTAYQSEASIGAQAEQASVTATAYDATVTASTNAQAESASASGAANNASVSITTEAEQASAAATAYDASVSVGVTADAEIANATVTAYDSSVSVDSTAEIANANATAYDATVSVGTTADAEIANATTTAYDATVSLTAEAEQATSTATSFDASGSVSPISESANATATAYDATISVSVQAEQASAAGAAYDATVDTGALVLVQEGYRFGTDDGSESAHGWEAPQDTVVTLPKQTTTLLRVLVEETGGAPVTAGRKLQYKLTTDPISEWRDVT